MNNSQEVFGNISLKFNVLKPSAHNANSIEQLASCRPQLMPISGTVGTGKHLINWTLVYEIMAVLRQISAQDGCRRRYLDTPVPSRFAQIRHQAAPRPRHQARQLAVSVAAQFCAFYASTSHPPLQRPSAFLFRALSPALEWAHRFAAQIAACLCALL